jgi:hypothetical protein
VAKDEKMKQNMHYINIKRGTNPNHLDGKKETNYGIDHAKHKKWQGQRLAKGPE